MTEEPQASNDLKSLRRQVALLWAGLAVLVAGWITARGLGSERYGINPTCVAR